MPFKKVFVHRYTPNKLAIHAYFDFAANENARLISVDNSTITTINCVYQYYSDVGRAARKETKTDEFTYPWNDNTATLNIVVKDTNGDNMIPAEEDSMDTSGAPED